MKKNGSVGNQLMKKIGINIMEENKMDELDRLKAEDGAMEMAQDKWEEQQSKDFEGFRKEVNEIFDKYNISEEDRNNLISLLRLI